MKFFKKNFLKIGWLLTVVAISPIVASCGVRSKTDSGIEADISTEDAKKLVLDLWTKKTLISLYNNYESKKLSFEIAFNTLDTLSQDIQTELFELFKIYAALKLEEDANYFITKKTEWDSSSLFTIANSQTLILLKNIVPNLKQFKILYNTSGVGIASDLNKLLLTKWYLTKSVKENIEKVDEYSKKISSKTSSTFLLYDSLDIDQSYFYLTKYLLENKIIEQWKYEKPNDNIAIITNRVVKTLDGSNSASYNSLFKNTIGISDNQKNLRKIFIQNLQDGLSSSTNQSEKIKLAKGYDKLQIATNNAGDLNFALSFLKDSFKIKNGLLNIEKNELISYDDLFLNKIFEKDFEINFRVKTKSLKKNKDAIVISDLEEQPDSSKNTVNYKIIELIQTKSTSAKVITIKIEMSKTHNGSTYKRNYFKNISWSSNSVKTSADQEAREIKNDVDLISLKIHNFNNNTLSITYINKIVPLFKTQSIVDIDGSLHRIGKFSLDNTPWLSNGVVDLKLIVSLSHLNANLFNVVKKYYVKIGYLLQAKINKTLQDQVDAEGISGKEQKPKNINDTKEKDIKDNSNPKFQE